MGQKLRPLDRTVIIASVRWREERLMTESGSVVLLLLFILLVSGYRSVSEINIL